MTIKLPELVPFNDPVTVCAACWRACCLASRRLRCPTRRAEATATAQSPLAHIQASAYEHPGYWKGDPKRDPDMPIDLVDLRELVADQRKRRQSPTDDRAIVAGYLEHELGIDPEQVAAAMAAEWPEVQS